MNAIQKLLGWYGNKNTYQLRFIGPDDIIAKARALAAEEPAQGDGLKHSPLPWKIKDSDQGSPFLVDVNNKPIIKQKPATYDEEGGWEYNDDDIKFIVDCCNSRHAHKPPSAPPSR